MSEALSYFYYFYSKFVSFMFNTYFVSGVSIGMFFVVVFVFLILITNFLKPVYMARIGRSNEK